MRKIIALLLIISSLLALASCGKNKYKPQESTKEEATTVMTVQIDGNKYDVRYELYRALFLNYKSTVDGGDPNVWTGDDKASYVEKIDSMILDRITEIYATFAICERIGFNVYSKDVEKEIQENIRISVEGGSYGSAAIQGYDSYEDYLAALKAANINYSVQVLLFRYAIAVDAIYTHYIGTVSSDDIDGNMSIGSIEYTKDDVKAFYDSEECARVLRAGFQKYISYTPKEDAQKLRSKLVDAANSADTLEEKDNKVFLAIMSSGKFPNSSELENGYVMGKYNLEKSYYEQMTDAVFALSDGEVSECIDLVTDVEDAYYVIYRAQKSDAHFEENYESIKYVYLTNTVGEILYTTANELRESVEYTDFLKNINHSGLGM